MDVKEVHEKMNKSQLIRTYKQWLTEEKRFSKNIRREGRFKQPIINGRKYSWGDFKRLPRDAVLVFIITEGCDVDYMKKLNEQGFYVEKREWHPNFGMNLFGGLGEEE